MIRTPACLLALLALPTLIACGEDEKPDGDDDTDADTDAGTDGTDVDTDAVITDADHDGHSSDVDCDDNDYTVFPGADELCDGVGND